MKKVLTSIIFVAMVAGFVAAQQADQPPLPPNHPPLPKAQDASPTADPKDVSSIDVIVKAYYDVISGPAGEARNWDRFRSLFIDDARFVTAKAVEDRRVPVMITPAEFMQFNKKYFERGGYFESEISRSVDSFGSIAHVFSTYEARHKLEEVKPYSRGINSIQLLNTGSRWWIVTVMWDHERLGSLPIPSRYLSDSLVGER